MHGMTVHPRALDHESLYKGCEGEIPHFFMVFLSLLLFPTKNALFSLLGLHLLRLGGAMVGGGGAVADHCRWRRRRCKPLLFISFCFFLLVFLASIRFYTPNSQILPLYS